MANEVNTKIFIANEVARRLETDRVTSIDEESKFAGQVRDMLPFYTLHVLERSSWRDATTRTSFIKLSDQEVETIGGGPMDLGHAYEIPANCLEVLGTSEGELVKFKKELHPTRDIHLIWVDQVIDQFVFVRKVEDYSLLSTDITLLIALYIAKSLAPFYLTDSRKVTQISKEILQMEYDFKARDIQETGREDINRDYPAGVSDYDDVRFAGFGSKNRRLFRFRRGY